MKKTLTMAAVVLLVAATAATTAPAADFGPGPEKKFQFELGGAWDSFDTSASLTYSRGRTLSGGVNIDFENLLDIPVMKEHVRLSGQWKFSRVSYVVVGWESIAREGMRVIDKDVAWGNVNFSADALIEGQFNSKEGYLGYRYDAWQAGNVRLGATIGFAVYDIDMSLTGNGTLTRDDGTVETGSFAKGFAIKAPVPVIGLIGEGAISSKVTFGFYVRALYISLSEVSGGTFQGGLKLKWYFTDNFGVGGSLDLTTINLRKWVKDNETLKANYSFAGPGLHAIVAF